MSQIINQSRQLSVLSLPVSGTDGIEIVPGNRFDRNPRMLVTTFWGDPVAAPKSDPPNLVNSADGEDSPVVLLELSSCDATVLPLWLCNEKLR